MQALFIVKVHLTTQKKSEKSANDTLRKILLWRRSTIEDINDDLKSICQSDIQGTEVSATCRTNFSGVVRL